ncbi:MAG TPA: DUF2877 domain-containing protein [Ktedonobacteraceae bacterium]|nr:DUF2877 domain-containing protein [Ktedonobacteraceae bacterium]
MAVALVALDYSRPIQPVFEQASRTGTVHSVFRKALNIVAGDTMLAVLSSELSRMPNSARLPAIVMHRLYTSLHPGMQVSIGDGKLLIPAIDFTLRLPQEPAWEPRPDVAAHHWHRVSIARHSRLLAQHLAQKARQDGLAPLAAPLLLRRPARETPLAQRALPLLQLLVRACRLEDSAGVEEAARGLVGLGPGLTPSGDDTLAGFVSVMALLSAQLCADALPREHLASIIASTAQPRTTRLSATLLAHAARGELAEHVGTLLTALALPVEESQMLLHAADRVLAYGAYSGGDTLLGMLLGLQALGIENTLHESGEYHGHTGVAQAKYLL